MLIVNQTVVALLVFVVVAANARPYQYIPEVPGWIPVYIRQGDQPLSEIHPALAEAFREDIEAIDDSATKNLLPEGNEISVESKPAKENNEQSDANTEEKNEFPQKTEALDEDSVVMKIPRASSLDKAELTRLAKELQLNKKIE